MYHYLIQAIYQRLEKEKHSLNEVGIESSLQFEECYQKRKSGVAKKKVLIFNDIKIG